MHRMPIKYSFIPMLQGKHVKPGQGLSLAKTMQLTGEEWHSPGSSTVGYTGK